MIIVCRKHATTNDKLSNFMVLFRRSSGGNEGETGKSREPTEQDAGPENLYADHQRLRKRLDDACKA